MHAMPTVGTKVPDRWVPTHRANNRTLYHDMMGETWYFAELGIIRAIYPDNNAGRNAVTVALIKGVEEANGVFARQLERIEKAA